MNNLRLLIQPAKTGPNTEEKIFNAQKVLNFYERIAGLTLSEVTEAKCNLRSRTWLSVGPKEWLNYPSLLSTATFILRIVDRFGPLEFENC